ncbi:MAG: alpha-ketoglutarate-dependent dioxygenase AlkB [Anaerolineae bacterium]
MNSGIPGLRYQANYLSEHEQAELLRQIDAQTWLTELKRRVQHYGYKYDYRNRRIDRTMALGALPDWLARLADRIRRDGYLPTLAEQVIVNEYLPGQGIGAHVDCEPCFGDTIISLSLGSGCVMDLRNLSDKRHVPLVLEPGSLLLLAGDARYRWTHGIVGRYVDSYDGQVLKRGRRVSVTLRTVILDAG